MNWLTYFINIAEQVKEKSKDQSTKIGVVVVGKDHEILSTGYNSFVRGIEDNLPERQSRENGEKYYWFEHAERNAIYNAARVGVALRDSMMYLTCGMPCADCARAIIQAGIKEIYINNVQVAKNKTLWEEHAKRSFAMFLEAKVNIHIWSYDKDGNINLKNGTGTTI